MARKHPKPNPHDHLAALAQQAAPQPAPVTIDLNNCCIQAIDINTPDGPQKILAFIHVTGGFVARCTLPLNLAREVATMLTTPPGLIVPTNGDNGGTP